MTLEKLILGFIGGAAYALIALLKSSLSGEPFETRKFLKTIILAGILASLNTLLGAESLSDADLLLRGAGETVLLDKALKSLERILEKLARGGRWLG